MKKLLIIIGLPLLGFLVMSYLKYGMDFPIKESVETNKEKQEILVKEEKPEKKEAEPEKKETEPTSQKESPQKEITLNTAQELEVGWESYIFSGFSNEDTFVFERDSEWVNTTYHKASVGYQFMLPRVKNIYFEVKEFNRDKGTITLKVIAIQNVE